MCKIIRNRLYNKLRNNNVPDSMNLDMEVPWFPLGVSSSIDGNEGGEAKNGFGTKTLSYSLYSTISGVLLGITH